MGCQSSSLSDDAFLQMQLLYCSPQVAPLRKMINTANANEMSRPYRFGDWDPAYGQTGLGIIYMPKQYYYQGGIRKGKAHGTGKIVWINQNSYVGDVSDGKASGTGKLVCPKQGITYDGDWADGHPNKGMLTYDGTPHEVSFKKTRQVTIKLKDESVYSGQIVRKGDQYIIEGKGKMSFVDGSYYQGHWKQGHMHGRGLFIWGKSNKKYQGDYHIGKKEGYGKYYYNANKWYEGMWQDGKQHGEGAIYQNGQKIFSGRWQHGINSSFRPQN